MIIQFCGLSGSGKSTLAAGTKAYFKTRNENIEVIDGDEYRKHVCPDLGFSKEDRNQNIRRFAFIAGRFADCDIIPIICAINPYEEIRKEIASTYPDVKTIYIKCSIEELIRRDTKGLYKRALLPEGHAEKISNLTGVNDPFEIPESPDLIIETDKEDIAASVKRLIEFISTVKK
ncbi:MAG: adenylyl-sulfate kinase [Bacteroidetes bacterium]|nr:MAG: adenylyl-sulfate kinase [Bacteroidota bacterium]